MTDHLHGTGRQRRRHGTLAERKRIAILVTFLGLAATGCKKDVTADIEKFADRAAMKMTRCATKAGADPMKMMSALKDM